jgi:hypothetical protein
MDVRRTRRLEPLERSLVCRLMGERHRASAVIVLPFRKLVFTSHSMVVSNVSSSMLMITRSPVK